MILAIDPGTEQSAWAVMHGLNLVGFGIAANENMRGVLSPVGAELVIEMIASYGMPVGAEVFMTCVWIGRFVEQAGGRWTPVYRRDVKLTLCGSPRAGDPHVRQAVIDMYPRTGGGKRPQIGTKAQPGPLYGVTSDVWSAIAVGLTHQIQTGRIKR